MKTKTLPRHYQALLDASLRAGLPTSFRTDLTEHDRRYCERTPPELPFVWALRESGTHIVSVDPNADRGNLCYLIPGYILDAFGPDTRFYVWDGVKLQHSGAFEAVEFLRAEYEKTKAPVSQSERA